MELEDYLRNQHQTPIKAHMEKQQLLYDEDDEEGGSRILYRASFHDSEDGLVGYETAQWLLLSLVLLLAWGVGLLMLFYLPFRRLAVRQDIRSRRLYVTTNAIVYKVEKPNFLPCFGVNRREKHILLPLVTNVAIEQGCLQSFYGIHSIRIENASRRKPPPGDDLQILGVDDPKMFRRMVMVALSNLQKERTTAGGKANAIIPSDEFSVDMHNPVPERSIQNWAWQQGTGLSSWQMSYSPVNDIMLESPHVLSGDMIIRRLEDLEVSIKRIEVLIEQSNNRPVEIQNQGI